MRGTNTAGLGTTGARAPGAGPAPAAAAIIRLGLARGLAERERGLLELLGRCDSAAAQALLAAICAGWDGRAASDGQRAVTRLGADRDPAPEVFDPVRAIVEPGRLVHTRAGAFRADLFAWVERADLAPSPRWGGTIVTVSGPDLAPGGVHRVAAGDVRRDPDVAREGLRVLRFTAAQVDADPFACGAQLDELLRADVAQARAHGRGPDAGDELGPVRSVAATA